MKTLAHSGDTAGILARLERIQPDLRPRWGRMSAHQMVCHVNDCFRMAIDGRPVRSVTGPGQRTLLKWIALYAPMRWPVGIRTMPEVDPERKGTPPVGFAEDVAEMKVLFDRFIGEPNKLEGVMHPIFGRMSSAAWLRWGYLHTDHHLRQFGL
jgi:hypothetical protein